MRAEVTTAAGSTTPTAGSRFAALLVVTMTLALAACDQPDGGVPSNTGSTDPPAAECSAALAASIGCDVLRSVAATEGETALRWVESGAVGLEPRVLNDVPTLVLVTPCNVLNVPIQLSGSAFTPGGVTSTAKGCEEKRTSQERWVGEFFRTEVGWERVGASLTLSSGDAVLEFVIDRPASSARGASLGGAGRLPFAEGMRAASGML